MEQRIDRLYPSAPSENNDLEHQLDKKLNDVNRFNTHINNLTEIFTYFKDNNLKKKKRFKI